MQIFTLSAVISRIASNIKLTTRTVSLSVALIIASSAFTTGQKGVTYGLPLTFTQTVDSINKMLTIHSPYGHHITVNNNGQALLTTRYGSFHFNFLCLENNATEGGYEVNGIEMARDNEGAHVVHNWIYFNSFRGTEAFIKLDEISRADHTTLHRLFLHLHNLCMQRLFVMKD
jgi:hypothetical protein